MKNSYANFKCQFRNGYVKQAMLLTVFLCNSNSTAVAITIRRFLTAIAVPKIFAHLAEYIPFERIVTLIAFKFFTLQIIISNNNSDIKVKRNR